MELAIFTARLSIASIRLAFNSLSSSEAESCVNVYEISTQKTIKITKEEYYNNKDRYIATGAKLKKYLSQQAQQS